MTPRDEFEPFARALVNEAPALDTLITSGWPAWFGPAITEAVLLAGGADPSAIEFADATVDRSPDGGHSAELRIFTANLLITLLAGQDSQGARHMATARSLGDLRSVSVEATGNALSDGYGRDTWPGSVTVTLQFGDQAVVVRRSADGSPEALRRLRSYLPALLGKLGASRTD